MGSCLVVDFCVSKICELVNVGWVYASPRNLFPLLRSLPHFFFDATWGDITTSCALHHFRSNVLLLDPSTDELLIRLSLFAHWLPILQDPQGECRMIFVAFIHCQRLMDPENDCKLFFSLRSELSIAVNFRHAICIMHHFQVCCKVMETANHSRFELLQVNMKGCTIQLLGVTIVWKLSCRMHCKDFSKHAFIVCCFIQAMYISKKFGPQFIHQLSSDRGIERPGMLNLLAYIYSSWLYVRYVRNICVKTEYSAVISFFFV